MQKACWGSSPGCLGAPCPECGLWERLSITAPLGSCNSSVFAMLGLGRGPADNKQSVMHWKRCLTPTGRNPALLSQTQHPIRVPATGVLCLSCGCCLLQFLEFHLHKAISSINEHRRGEREVGHSCILWCLCFCFIPEQ